MNNESKHHVSYSEDLDPYTTFINKIYDYNLHNIDNMYRDLKSRFVFSPFFLGNLKNIDLTDFIINLYNVYKYNDLSKDDRHLLNTFNDYYHSELSISYNIMKKFLKEESINVRLEYNDWLIFACTYSDLHELFTKSRLY